MTAAVLDPATAEAVERAAAALGARAERNAPLGPLTTYRVGGPAALLVRVGSPDDLGAVHRAVAVSGLPILVVGRGSNLLVADTGFAGIAVTLGAFAETIDLPLGDLADTAAGGGVSTEVVAGAAVRLPVLARRTVAAGLRGLEWAVGVPGSVGGGVRMNAGGHGSDVAASLLGVRVFDLRSGEHGEMPAAVLGLRFRGSGLDDHQVVLSARFGLDRGDRAASEAVLADIVRWRRERQPGGQNAGSVFVNPLPGQLAAAELIDGLGLRGLRIGTAEVSTKHANFIQSDEGGRSTDVHAVIVAVRSRVLDATGIALRSEIRHVGFDAAVPVAPDSADGRGGPS